MDKLLLVDGHNLLFKAFFGIPERLLPDGRPVQGIIGFVGILRKILRQTKPSHVLVVFDPEEKPTRALRYDRYKANRRDFSGCPERENPFSQLVHIKNALDSLGIRYAEEAGCEADDMIASYAVNSDCEVVIVSSDTDFFQLVNESILVLRYGGEKQVLFDEDLIMTKYGVHPDKFLEFKALVGDKADNIAGLKGIGPKNALKVLHGKRTLNQEEIGLFEMNRDLIKLNTGIGLHYDMTELVLDERVLQVKIGDLLPK